MELVTAKTDLRYGSFNLTEASTQDDGQRKDKQVVPITDGNSTMQHEGDKSDEKGRRIDADCDEEGEDVTMLSQAQSNWRKAGKRLRTMNALQDTEKARERENAASIENYIEQMCNIYTYTGTRNVEEKVITDNDKPGFFPLTVREYIFALFPGGKFDFERDFPNVRFVFDPDATWRITW